MHVSQMPQIQVLANGRLNGGGHFWANLRNTDALGRSTFASSLARNATEESVEVVVFKYS